MAQFIKNRWVKIIGIVALSLLLLLSATAIALQIPAVQTKVINYITGVITEKTGYGIKINRISLRWLDRLKAENVVITDLEGNLMISAGDITANYELKGLITNSTKILDFVEINNAEVNARIITYEDTLQNLNLTEFINRLRNLSLSEKGGSGVFLIDDVRLTNSTFTYMDFRRDTIIPGFNYNNFKVANINANVTDLMAHVDTLQMNIQSLTANVPSNDLPLHKVTGQFRISRKALEFNNIDIHIGKSIIRDTVVMAFDSPKDLQDFNQKVDISAHFKNSLIHTEDLALFVPYLKGIEDQYRLTGNFNGTVNNFRLSDATLRLGKGTRMKGVIRMEGLPYISETFMNYKLVDSYVLIEDLKPYLSEATIKRMTALHYLQMDGQLIGFVNDFVANGSFETRLGRIKSDINVKIPEDVNNSVYSGNLALIDFNLGAYANEPKISKVTLKGNIKGSGLTINNADFKMEGTIESIGYNNYKYKNITTNGHFRNNFFDGQLEIKDKNAEIVLSGSVDLKKDNEAFNIDTRIKKLNLKPLNFSEKDIYIEGNAVVNARGINIDSVAGEGVITDAFVKVNKRSLKIDSLNFNSTVNKTGRELQLNSDLVDLELKGEFTPSYAYRNIRQLIREYDLAFENNSNILTSYYQEKNLLEMEDYHMDFNILIKNFNPFLNLMGDSLYVAKGTRVIGDLTGGYTSIFNMNLVSDSIRYSKNAFKETLVDLSISKIADSTDVLAMVYIESKQQDLGPVLRTENLKFESIWNNNHIDFDFFVQQQNSSNLGLINGNIDFVNDKLKVTFKESEILLFEKYWHISQDNMITFAPGMTTFENLELQHDYQKISFNGAISRTPGYSLEIVLDSVELMNFNPILRKPIDGRVNGRVSFRDVYDNFKLNIIAAVQNFQVDSFAVGNISGSTFYNDEAKNSDITIVVERDKTLIASIQGSYKPRNIDNELDLNARINQAPLHILEPFLENYFTNIVGSASGDFKLTGSLKKPVFDGEGIIDNAGLHVNYLNTSYRLAGNFSMDENSIDFNQVQIRDFENNFGIIQGSLNHKYFYNFNLDLNGNVNNFLVLNTTSKDNDLFYGIGYATGTILFKGDVSNLHISAQARTVAGTKIFIPIGETGEIKKQEYINFVSFGDSLKYQQKESNEVDLSGISLDLALDVTTDAYAEIIFDIKSGDIIRGRGEGDIRLQISPTGEFNMFGDFFIREGGYNFTLYNIVNKEFEILPNSRISWYGDPYQGQMDIKATYEQLASLQPVIPQVTELEAEQIPIEIKRKYQSKVLMDLNGPLLSPNIDFDIEVENLPNYQVTLEDGTPIEMNFLFSRFKNSWDEQELNRQVFSLIVLRKFSPLQSFSTGGSLASSVSELLSNQLSYWITQVNENLEIDVDLSGLDPEAFNTFQLRLSYTLFDGRLRIIRDGGFTNPYETTNTTDTQTKVPGFIGDWTVEYLLTSDGKLRVKMYNRTNYSTLDANNQNSVITAGFSLQHIQSFDQLKELFQKSKDEKKQQEIDSTLLIDAKKTEDEIL